MSLREKIFGPKAEQLTVNESVADAESLLRLAESNDLVRSELEQFESRVAEIKQQAGIGGGMTPDDWSLINQAARNAAERLERLGASVTAEAFVAALES